METSRQDAPSSADRLGLWDTASVIVGIIVGVGIYTTPARVFENSPGPWAALGLWLAGGLFCLVGALCYAELASTYPRSGGEYVYLTRAYGPCLGFLFGWAQLLVIRPAGSLAVVAFGFAEYGGKLVGLDSSEQGMLACLAAAPLVMLTLLNIGGVALGKWAQNGLTLLKVVGIAGILLAGFFFGPDPATTTPRQSIRVKGLAIPLMYILWAYAGWQEAAYVASEVRNRRRNLPLALLLGTGAVAILYVLINLAYVRGLGFERASGSLAPAADVLALALGPWGAWAMSLLVVISTLGALNGMIFTSSRIFAEMGADHPLLAPLGRWSPRWGTPVRSLLLQGALSVAVVFLVGLVPRGKKGFDLLLEGTAGIFWLFFLLTGVAVLVLRYRDAAAPRPFAVPLYPWTPLVFCAGCAEMLYGSVVNAPWENAGGLALLAAGLPLYFLSEHLCRRRRAGQLPAPPAEPCAAASAPER